MAPMLGTELREWWADRKLVAERAARVAQLGDARRLVRDELELLRSELAHIDPPPKPPEQQPAPPDGSADLLTPVVEPSPPEERLGFGWPLQLLPVSWQQSAAEALPRSPRSRLPHGAVGCALQRRRERAGGVAPSSPRYAVAHAQALASAAERSAAAGCDAVWLEMPPKGIPVHPFAILSAPSGAPLGGGPADAVATVLRGIESAVQRVFPDEDVCCRSLSVVRSGRRYFVRWRLLDTATDECRPLAGVGELCQFLFIVAAALRTGEDGGAAEWLDLAATARPCPQLPLPGPSSPNVVEELAAVSKQFADASARFGAEAVKGLLVSTPAPPPPPDGAEIQLHPARPLTCRPRRLLGLPETVTLRGRVFCRRELLALDHPCTPWTQRSDILSDRALSAEARSVEQSAVARELETRMLRRCGCNRPSVMDNPSDRSGNSRKGRRGRLSTGGGRLSPQALAAVSPIMGRRPSSARPLQVTPVLEQQRRISAAAVDPVAAAAAAERAQAALMPTLYTAPDDAVQLSKKRRQQRREVRELRSELVDIVALEYDHENMAVHDALSAAAEDERRKRDNARLRELRSARVCVAREEEARAELALKNAQEAARVDRARAAHTSYVERVRRQLATTEAGTGRDMLRKMRQNQMQEQEQASDSLLAAMGREKELQRRAELQQEEARLVADLGCFVEPQ
eukprot:TRINITY_DN44020_c0_g1_i1.p1 TRINITY_DN44020_c0_g1~~TRINITY_DN44020_c0_g1_i1.p1  ORF type:complete len:688 (+),score=235.48 TRINITY_DN44020_c0_g1_i1:46-2109(+)